MLTVVIVLVSVIRPVQKLSDEVLVWLSVWSKVQVI